MVKPWIGNLAKREEKRLGIGPLMKFAVMVKVQSETSDLKVYPPKGWDLKSRMDIEVVCTAAEPDNNGEPYPLGHAHLSKEDQQYFTRRRYPVTYKKKCELCGNHWAIVCLNDWCHSAKLSTKQSTKIAEIALSGCEPRAGDNVIVFGHSLIAESAGAKSEKFMLGNGNGGKRVRLYNDKGVDVGSALIRGITVTYERMLD